LKNEIDKKDRKITVVSPRFKILMSFLNGGFPLLFFSGGAFYIYSKWYLIGQSVPPQKNKNTSFSKEYLP
jgi:hypothetical protein